MDPFSHPWSTVICICSLGVCSRILSILLWLIVITDRGVKVPLLSICGLRSTSSTCTHSTIGNRPLVSSLHHKSTRPSDLRFAYKTVSLLWAHARVTSSSCIVAIVVYKHWYPMRQHILCLQIQNSIGPVLSNGSSRLDLLRWTCTTTSSHVVETLGFLHILKIQSAWIGRADLFDSLTVFLLELFQSHSFLLWSREIPI